MQPIEQVTPQGLTQHAERRRERTLAFATALLRTPSFTGQEGALCELIAAQMRDLGFDEVFVDELGNCVGRIAGNATGPSVLFACPLDHGPVGDTSRWSFGPFDGTLADGFLHGKGASEHKGAIAAMLFGLSMLKEVGHPLKGDLIFAGIVQTHALASLGMRYLLDKTLPGHGIHCDLVVLGNPTNLDLYLGHRGRVEMEVVTIGRTSHASAPWLASNAIFKMIPVISGLQDLATTLPSHPFLEKSTVALTTMRTDPDTTETIPDRCSVILDRRFLPSETVDDALWQVQSVLNRLASADAEFKGEVNIQQVEATSYTGEHQVAARLLHAFTTDSAHALVQDVASALEGLGQSPAFGKWTFSTDGGYPATVKKLATIGYAPGDEKFAQTPFDRLKVEQVVAAVAGYAAIGLKISG